MAVLENLQERIKAIVTGLSWLKLLSMVLVVCLIFANGLYITGTLVGHYYQTSIPQLSSLGFMAYILSIFGLGYYLSDSLTPRRGLQLAVAYFIYLGLSYLLLLTQFINRSDFKPDQSFANDFWELRYLPTIILILVVAGLIKVIKVYVPVQLSQDLTVSPNLIFSGLLLNTVLCDAGLLELVFAQMGKVSSASTPILLSTVASVLSVFIGYFWPICFWGVKSLDDLMRNRASLSLAISFSLLLAVIFNYTLQLGVQGQEALLGKYIFPGAILYQILFLTTFFILIYSVLNRFIPATLIIIALGILASVVNSLKVAMRSEPLLVTDLVWLKQMGLLLGFVDKTFVARLVIGVLVVAVIIVLTRKRLLKDPLIKSLLGRAVVLVSLLAFIHSVYSIFRDEDYNKVRSNIPVISVLNNWQDINWLGFETNARYKSLAFVWSKQLSKRLMVKPDGYNAERVAAIFEKYMTLAKTMNEERTGHITDQTVIYILSESFANPAYIDGVHLSDNPIAFISQLGTETTSGLMKSDFYGGGTANMEFQSLTGLPFYNFSPSIAIAYTEIVPKLRYMPSISDYFEPESRIAMHPANARNYDRVNIYDKLHFGKFLADKGTDEQFTNAVPVGVFMGDEALYANILEQLDVSKNQFFSVITMQNHTPWHAAGPEELTASGIGFNDTQTSHLINYSRLLYHTDKATERFLEQLKAIDKTITVVFYGDHLPGFYPTSVFKDKPETQYQTDYFIWTNDTTTKLHYPLLNSSDFIAALFEHTNAKVSPYYALLTQVLKHASVDKQGSEWTSEQEDIADDLRVIQYDLASGKGYILNYPEFFDLNP